MLLDLLHDRLRIGGTGVRLAALSAALVAAFALAGGLADGARADAAQVTVVSPGGSEQTLSLDALAGGMDVVDRTYAVRSASDEEARTVSGFSLAAILEAAGADPYGFSHLEAQRPAGGSVLLSRHQALDPGAFADGPPVVYATPTGTAFLRPSAGAGDLNATDSFEAPQGITLVLGKGSPLEVRAKASTPRGRPGVAISFSAIVEGAGAGEQLTYSWYFDDGHSATGAGASHSFAKPGSYDVVVGVTTAGDRAGASAVVTVQIGAPLSGPDRKGGGRNRDAAAPDHGAADGTSAAVPPGPGTASPAAEKAAPPKPAPDARRNRPAPSPPAGKLVSGTLLTGAETAPLTPAETPAARRGEPSDSGAGTGLPDAAIGLLVTAGLLGLGAISEARSLFR